jgi:hypothetical protein
MFQAQAPGVLAVHGSSSPASAVTPDGREADIQSLNTLVLKVKPLQEPDGTTSAIEVSETAGLAGPPLAMKQGCDENVMIA